MLQNLQLKHEFCEDIYIKAKIHDLLAEYSARKQITQDSSIIKRNDLVIMRDWFPVYHCGYYAVIGFNSVSNEFIMSEPIIGVFSNSQRLFESPRKYYEIVGDCSLKSFEMFQRVYNPEVYNYLLQSLKDFKHGLPKKWIECISMLHKLSFYSMPKQLNYMINVINSSFEEISNPSSNYVFTETLFIKNMKICLNEVFKLIKKRKCWRGLFAKELHSYGHQNLIKKLKYKNIKNVLRPDSGNYASEYTALFLWLPMKDSVTEDYLITGYILNEEKDLIEFQSKILYVNISGTHIITENGSVKIMGPICTIKYEAMENSAIINVLADKYIQTFFYGLPKYWRKYVTIIEIILKIDFAGREFSNVVDESENKENVAQVLKIKNEKGRKLRK